MNVCKCKPRRFMHGRHIKDHGKRRSDEYAHASKVSLAPGHAHPARQTRTGALANTAFRHPHSADCTS